MTTIINDIARIAHEVNRAYCEAIGDHSQLEWRHAPDWQKDSAINGVKAHMNSDLTPEQSHELWLKQKLREGWRWGSIKDPAKKEHPCCVPYSELSNAHKVKDYLFRAVVHALRPTAPPVVAEAPTLVPEQQPEQGEDVAGATQLGAAESNV